jgi:hypothetical protein
MSAVIVSILQIYLEGRRSDVLIPLALHRSYNKPSTSELTALVPSSTNAYLGS